MTMQHYRNVLFTLLCCRLIINSLGTFLFGLDDHSRVRLQRYSVDYINASLVEVPDANRAYILTQVCSCYCFTCIVDDVAFSAATLLVDA